MKLGFIIFAIVIELFFAILNLPFALKGNAINIIACLACGGVGIWYIIILINKLRGEK